VIDGADSAIETAVANVILTPIAGVPRRTTQTSPLRSSRSPESVHRARNALRGFAPRVAVVQAADARESEHWGSRFRPDRKRDGW
jgi:hypothetical protein